MKWLCYLALPLAMLGLLLALDLSACPGYSTQRDGTGALAALYVVFAITTGRTIGVCFGLIYCRVSLVGALIFAAAQVGSAAVVVVAVADAAARSATDRFVTALGPAGLAGLVAALVGALLAGCYAMRRAT